MNYDSVQAILDAGTTNMTVLRNNSRQDDGTDTVTGVSWFTFNGNSASTIYVSGNSFIGFGSSTAEHIKVNRRDGALWSLYREEGTLFDHYRFLKIRWQGSSNYSNSSYTSEYYLTYDVILWDTGDISLHMVQIPTKYNNGYYNIAPSGTISYSVSTSSPDVTFTKNGNSFSVSNSIIDLQLPFINRYLVRDNTTYYTISNNTLSAIEVSELTSEVFTNSGVENIPSISLLSSLTAPEILFWSDNPDTVVNDGLVVKGTPPLPQTIYYNLTDMTGYSNISKVECVASDDALFTITFDGRNWIYYDGVTWVEALTTIEGMTSDTMSNIPINIWEMYKDIASYQVRCVLPSKTSFAGEIYVNHI